MTYCLAIERDEGIVFASDTRTNAGVDYITKYSKMHVFQPADNRIFVLLSAGSLATTQEVVDNINQDMEINAPINLRNAATMPIAVQYIGEVSQRVQNRHANALIRSGFNGETTFILGGQISGQKHGIYLVYPQGNYIAATKETPYLQIGETKYGKPILDRTSKADLSLEDNARIALVSLDATIKSNITVGPPLEVAIYEKDALHLKQHLVLEENDAYYQAVQSQWNQKLKNVIHDLPKFDWEIES